MAKLNFNANNVDPQKPLDPIPTGWYPAMIVESELKPTKDTKGTMLALTWEVVDGEYKGRKVFDRLNIKNANKQAEEIAAGQLSAICHATGVMQVKDSAELHNKPLQIRVIKRAASEQYDESNEVKAYKPLEGGPSAAPAGAGGAAPAWAGKKPGATPPPAGKTPPPAPGKAKSAPPPPTPAPEPEPDLRAFYVYVEGESLEKSGDEIREMLAEGMPEDTPVVLTDESSDGWKTVADYGLNEPNVPATPATTPPPAPAPAGKTPPWKKK